MPAVTRKTAILELPKPGQPYEDDERIEIEIYEM